MLNEISLKSISDLLDMSFYIPDYQRGYRWDNQQVNDLLNDVWEFCQRGGKAEGEFYCLQPVIVRRDDGIIRLVDGQQRITTIYILLTYLEAAIDALDLPSKKYSIEYETRLDSKDFLKSINNTVGVNDENIDYYYMSSVYMAIKEWFESNSVNKGRIANALLESITDGNHKDLSNNVRFIWYELNSNESENKVFARINSGKIPLTNAELIKALFLNRKNFANDEEKKLRQIEIAKEWDEIEYDLQNDEFWGFLTKAKDIDSRIEIIFDVLSGGVKTDEYSTYRYFSKNKSIVDLWDSSSESVKKIYLSFKYWFDDRELYHLIGYLISSNLSNISEIYNDFKNKSKTEFRLELYQKIKKTINLDKLEELEYGADDKIISRVLLLFNIATLLTSKSSYIRFSFEKFKSETWSIEHVHAQNDIGNTSQEAKEIWLNDAKNALLKVTAVDGVDELLNNINEMLSETRIDDDGFREMQIKVFDVFGDDNREVHSIDNLALLSVGDNSSLSDNVFPVKRKILISKDEMGGFIPVCTKNVFLKYYSKSDISPNFWNRVDRKEYITEMKRVLCQFVGGSNVNI